MLEEKSEEIMGIQYVFRQMPARQAARWAYRAGKAIGPSLSALMKAPSAFDVAVKELFVNLSEAESLDFLEAFLCQAQREGVVIKKEQIDIIYAGKGGEMIAAAAACAQWILGSFMSGLTGIGGLSSLVGKPPAAK